MCLLCAGSTLLEQPFSVLDEGDWPGVYVVLGGTGVGEVGDKGVAASRRQPVSKE